MIKKIISAKRQIILTKEQKLYEKKNNIVSAMLLVFFAFQIPGIFVIIYFVDKFSLSIEEGFVVAGIYVLIFAIIYAFIVLNINKVNTKKNEIDKMLNALLE